MTTTPPRTHRRATSLWQFRFDWLPGTAARDNRELIDECVELYNSAYGTWGEGSGREGRAVKVTPDMVDALLAGDGASLATARQGAQLVGYCIAVRFEIHSGERIAWVSQLVVGSSYRKAGLATTLLYSVWQFSDCYAWGLATANPYAVRALETATRRRCRAKTVTEHGPDVLAALQPHVGYLPSTLMTADEGTLPVVDTQFFIDHSNLEEMRRNAARQERPWDLGSIGLGQEWFACTFRSQPPEGFDDARMHTLLEGADEIWIAAYERMTLDGEHVWHQHTDSEVAYISRMTGAAAGTRVIDVGCGDGRHARALADLGCDVTAVDIAGGLLQRAGDAAEDAPVRWRVADAREDDLGGPYDVAIALYDVLGSSGSDVDDRALLEHIRDCLLPGGFLVLSVMHSGSVLPLPAGHEPATVTEFVAALEALEPSRTMASSGNIFNRDLLLRFQGVFYRKEQFEGAMGHLPTELVVRDLRYTADELASIVSAAGFEIVSIRPVRLGHWLDSSFDDAEAKELLLVARRV